MLQTDKEDVDFHDISDHLEELSDYEMNGREIRNAVTTARQIALYKKETLCWKHIGLTINTARDFTRYLGKLHGHTEEQWAREKKERWDIEMADKVKCITWWHIKFERKRGLWWMDIVIFFVIPVLKKEKGDLFLVHVVTRASGKSLA